jgi:benzoylformate decarboxylase
VSFVILNNQRYAALEHFAKIFGMNGVPGTTLTGIDFVGMATAMGIAARRVEDHALLDDALRWSFAASGPTLLDLAIA